MKSSRSLNAASTSSSEICAGTEHKHRRVRRCIEWDRSERRKTDLVGIGTAADAMGQWGTQDAIPVDCDITNSFLVCVQHKGSIRRHGRGSERDVSESEVSELG